MKIRLLRSLETVIEEFLICLIQSVGMLFCILEYQERLFRYCIYFLILHVWDLDYGYLKYIQLGNPLVFPSFPVK